MWKITKKNSTFYPGCIHSGMFPGENLVRKITPRWKTFGFFTSRIILHYLVHPGENIESLIVHSEFLNFTLMSFDITQSLLCDGVSSKSEQSVVTLSPEYQVKIISNDRLAFTCFYSLFMVSWELNVVYSKIC